MNTISRRLLMAAAPFLLTPVARGAEPLDVRSFGAKGDGHAIDSAAINAAIDRAAQAGGGVVRFPAGTYASYSIRLKSGVTLVLETGSVIMAAPVPRNGLTSGGFDAAESNAPWEAYQDFGHNHWHNSLIWGEDLHDVAILGPGLIDGSNLSRSYDWDQNLPLMRAPGAANKAIALKNCRNVSLRDFAILRGGHFGILASGVDNLLIEGLRIDTNRDGMDIDCCRNVSITDCIVNSPEDDGICLKSSYALGSARATENVSITGCHVTGGYLIGTLLDGTFKRFDAQNGGERAYTGRIKAGTESNGGYRNVTVSGCTFESCRGFALESVDGAIIEDVTFTGNTMRDIRAAPAFFLRLAARMRGPAGVPVGVLQRVLISDCVCDVRESMPSIISGIPGHRITDVRIDNVVLRVGGGGTAAMASATVAEQVDGYPEPRRFGTLPAAGFFIRHVENIEMSNVEIEPALPDARPIFVLDDVVRARFFRLSWPQGEAGFLLDGVSDLSLAGSAPHPDQTIAQASHRTI